MRIKVDLELKNSSKIEANYNYFFYEFVKNLFFQEKIINQKIDSKEIDFCYALRFVKFKHLENFISLEDPRLFFVMTYDEKRFGKISNVSSYLNKIFTARSAFSNYEFVIKKIKFTPLPKFNSPMKFVLLSPMTLSVKKITLDKELKYYLRPNNINEINAILSRDLSAKARSLGLLNKLNQGKVYLEWDENYLKSKFRITKKITLNLPEKTMDVIGIMAPFKISGDIELIKAGYELGFGEMNQYGFGLAEPAAVH